MLSFCVTRPLLIVTSLNSKHNLCQSKSLNISRINMSVESSCCNDSPDAQTDKVESRNDDGEFVNDKVMMSILSTLETEDVTSSISSVIYDEIDGNDNIESNLTFLDEKRDILKRVSDLLDSNDIYDASIAKNEDLGSNSELFDEAKEIIAALSRKTTAPRKVTFATSTKTLEKRKALRNSPRKKARIDISSVEQVSSKSYNAVVEKERPYDDKWMFSLQNIHNDMFAGGERHTITSIGPDALEHHIGETNATLNQLLSSLNNVKGIPKSRSYSTMEDALAITDQPQIIAESNKPFLSFHANKAFLDLAGMSKKDIIGKPIEAIIDSNSKGRIENLLLEALDSESSCAREKKIDIICHATFEEIECQVEVKSVLCSTADAASYLMIQIHPRNFCKNPQQQSHTQTKKPTNILVGTVG